MNSKLCKMLIQLSKETWERIEFSRNRTGLKIFETTITQNLLYSINKNYNNLPIQLFEAIDEKTNGNDLEIYLQTKSGYIFLPTQAKILYSNYKYTSMDHSNQIDDLLSYAKKHQGFPMYLLYNYVASFNPNRTICNIKLLDTHYGCTLISAQYLYDNFAYKRKTGRWNIPSFNDLHPNYSFPWLVLGCCSCSNLQPTFDKIDFNIESLKLFSLNELKNNNWRKIDFGRKFQEELHSAKNDGNKKFSPKFRIIIGNKY